MGVCTSGNKKVGSKGRDPAAFPPHTHFRHTGWIAVAPSEPAGGGAQESLTTWCRGQWEGDRGLRVEDQSRQESQSQMLISMVTGVRWYQEGFLQEGGCLKWAQEGCSWVWQGPLQCMKDIPSRGNNRNRGPEAGTLSSSGLSAGLSSLGG